MRVYSEDETLNHHFGGIMKTKVIEGFPDYLISEDGRVISLKFGGYKELKLIQWKGYVRVGLLNNGVTSTKKVHRLVAQAFIPNPHNKPYINHKNGIKDDNRVENLEWVTPKENSHHAVETGLLDIKGEKSPGNKYPESVIRSICEILRDTDKSVRQIARETGVSQDTCRNLSQGRKWKHLTEEYGIVGKRKRENPKLSEETVFQICLAYNAGLKPRHVVEKFGITVYQAGSIRQRRVFKEITERFIHATPTTIESTQKCS